MRPNAVASTAHVAGIRAGKEDGTSAERDADTQISCDPDEPYSPTSQVESVARSPKSVASGAPSPCSSGSSRGTTRRESAGYMAGAAVDAVYPLVAIGEGTPIAVALLSYADQMHIGIDTDPEMIPDPHRLGELLGVAIDALETLSRAESCRRGAGPDPRLWSAAIGNLRQSVPAPAPRRRSEVVLVDDVDRQVCRVVRRVEVARRSGGRDQGRTTGW